MLDRLRSIPEDERIALPGQIKVKIVSFITGRGPTIVFPWEDPIQAAEDLMPVNKIENAEQNKAAAEQWLTEWMKERDR